ncbi:hypothetical protein TNIN_277911 [Trichonephila inaurata madagascariensis]|uniref:Uncharacterized protein n=1 Tax=Trichonephila inaurata madagascariensis TaxID=2747483 RepID=A0A8X6I2Q1_9ARAC|nr:hypothetical protein TNIN_277911 [Trichonephila inaurata madagascariensis]
MSALLFGKHFVTFACEAAFHFLNRAITILIAGILSPIVLIVFGWRVCRTRNRPPHPSRRFRGSGEKAAMPHAGESRQTTAGSSFKKAGQFWGKGKGPHVAGEGGVEEEQKKEYRLPLLRMGMPGAPP